MFRCVCATTAPKPVELHTALYLSMLAAVWMATVLSEVGLTHLMLESA